MSRPPAELAGRVFERLTALERVGSDQHGSALWRCRCACGEPATVRSKDLLSGQTRSCGCLRAEASAVLVAGINARRASRAAERGGVA